MAKAKPKPPATDAAEVPENAPAKKPKAAKKVAAVVEEVVEAPVKKAAKKKAATPAVAKKASRKKAPVVEKRGPPDDSPSVKRTGASLVIVESPAKAKTINKILGKGYVVKASMGHVRDLPKSKFGIDVDHGFEPQYIEIKDRKDTLKDLKDASKNAPFVYLAPDPDREGEAIAWHLAEALNVGRRAKRVTFNEITKRGVEEGFKKVREVAMNLVNAQQARRLLDRIVGYKLSPLLWEKVARGLSAGRVQSVASKLVVDREKEIRAFKAEEFWRLIARVTAKPGVEEPPEAFKAELKRVKDGAEADLHTKTEAFDEEKLLDDKGPGVEKEEDKEPEKKEFLVPDGATANGLVEELKTAQYRIVKVEKKSRRDNPPPPFTTSLLQQTASVKLHFPTRRTMAIAQQLYEGVEIGEEGTTGLITYMRTDSYRLSEDALVEIRGFVVKSFGQKYLETPPRVWAARKGAQEAHEAIRPTSVEHTPDLMRQYLNDEQFKLYQLIWQRTVGTQMAPAEFDVTSAEIEAGRAVFGARGRVMAFDGYTRVAGHRLKKEEQILPPLAEGQILTLIGLDATQHFTQPPARFTEASLVKALEQNGIGRPSTYAPIVATIQDRGYVKQENRALHATELGEIVNGKLEKHFPEIVNTDFTRLMEEKLDAVEESKADWHELLREFHDVFVGEIERAKTEMTSEKGQVVADAPLCEKCGKPMLLRWNKWGGFWGCSGYPECKSTKPKDAPPPELSNEKCEKCGKPMALKRGRFGQFLACTGYPECKTTRNVVKGKDGGVIVVNEKCEICGAPMRVCRGKRGPFLGCSKYPECKSTKPIPKAKPEGEEAPAGDGEGTAAPAGE
ncbi:MAG: type I DNA topoisomerase [Planctomycetes bacterium]|nr:type I DNA topoisomerase [Planctomycetota bacterium]